MAIIGVICAVAVTIYFYLVKRELEDTKRENAQRKVDETLNKIETEVMAADIDDLNARNEERYSRRVRETK